MKKLTRKLFVSVLSLAFAVVALGATTFAWFTLGGTVTASTFTADVTTGEGIEVSIDGSTFKSVLTTEDIIAEFDSKMNTISSGSTFANNFKFRDNTSNDGLTIKKGGVADANATAFSDGFIEFKLTFRSPTENQKVYLVQQEDVSAFDEVADASSLGGTYIVATGKTWTSDANVDMNDDGDYIDEGEIAVSTAYTFYASNATRISFKGQETTDAAVIYAPEGQGTSFGAASVDGFAKKYADAKGFVIPNTTTPASGAALTTTLGNGVAVCTLTTQNSNGHNTPATTTSDGWYYNTVTVRIWLEGWDADCINAILSSPLAIQLKFSATQTA